MDNYIEILEKTPLFEDIKGTEIKRLLSCLDAKARKYDKNEFVWLQGDTTHKVSIVLKGQVKIVKEDISGNRTIISTISPPGIFGESLVCSGTKNSPVSVQAAEKTEIMMLDFLSIIRTCHNSCEFHTRLIQNMLKIIALKNINLNKKINYLSGKTIKQKLASFILDNMHSTSDLYVTLPYNREDLADYLNVNRSALSRELSNMRNEKILTYRKNIFHITDISALLKISNG